MKKYSLLVLCFFILVSCGNSEQANIDTLSSPVAEKQIVEKNSDVPVVSSNIACIQSWTVSEPGLDTYSVTTCMSTITLDEDKFKMLCELWSQLEWADITVTYVKECPKPYYGICKNWAPEQSVKAMWWNWDVYYYDQKDIVVDSSWKPYCDDFEKGAL